MRGTYKGKKFIKNVDNGDATYLFVIPARNSKTVWVFESPIDALSHGTLCKYGGLYWLDVNRIP